MTNTNNNCPLCAGQELQTLSAKLRDSETLSVLQCQGCSHIFLDNFDHIDPDFYATGGITKDRPFGSEIEARLRHFDFENEERLQRVGNLIINKRVLDFGCGAGDLLERVVPKDAVAHGVEPNVQFREYLVSKGLTVFPKAENIEEKYDVILSFHVLEHLKDPVGALRQLKHLLNPGGTIYLEVPNVNDALRVIYEVDEYGVFHFFKSHLHYFSRQSMQQIMQARLFPGLHFPVFWSLGHCWDFSACSCISFSPY